MNYVTWFRAKYLSACNTCGILIPQGGRMCLMVSEHSYRGVMCSACGPRRESGHEVHGKFHAYDWEPGAWYEDVDDYLDDWVKDWTGYAVS